MEWQPIETAPKDKTIVVFDPNQQTTRVVEWMTAMEDGEGAWIYAAKRAWEEPMKGEAIAFYVSSPTHWMPLPEPPK